MFDPSLKTPSSGQMIREGGSHPTSSLTSGFWSPGAEACPAHPLPGQFSVGMGLLEETRATGLAWLVACSCLLTRLRVRSPDGLMFRCNA